MLTIMEDFPSKDRDGRAGCGSKKATFALKFRKARVVTESI